MFTFPSQEWKCRTLFSVQIFRNYSSAWFPNQKKFTDISLNKCHTWSFSQFSIFM